MNKLLKYISTASIAAAVLCSCSLEETPYGQYSNKTFFLTANDAENALLYAYVPINYIEYAQRFMFYFGDCLTDEIMVYPGKSTDDLTSWDIKNTTEYNLYYFKNLYVALGRCNSVLENVAKMDIAQDKKNKIMGEAYFLRAFHHFNLVQNWGSVPLRTKTVSTVADTFADKSSIEDVWNQIISDLEEAEKNLPVSKVQGRADKVAAQALLARAYLTLASSKETGSPGYDWVKSADDMYAKAAEEASKVIKDQSVYKLDPSLDDVYSVYKQNVSPEHIFITGMNREASGMEGTYAQLPFLFMIQYSDNLIYVSEKLVPEVDPETGKVKVMKMMNEKPAWEGMNTNYEYLEELYADNDLRKRLFVTTIYTEDGDVFREWSKDNIKSSDTHTNKFYYPFCRKYSDPESISSHSSANMYLIRYAEVLLTYAEAVGPTKEGYDCINKVRERAGLENLPSGLNKTDFREAVYQERNRELYFEGKALYDLRRLNRVNATYITRITPKETAAYFFPYPQREEDLNPQK